MAGFAISPYAPGLQFVGTDMGTLFRTADGGAHWTAIDQREVGFDSNLDNAAPVGFSADPRVIFHAPAGVAPKRSLDSGVTWWPMSVPLASGERILYWTADSAHPERAYATTTTGLLRTADKGLSWSRIAGVSGPGLGTALIPRGAGAEALVFHATSAAILVSQDGGLTFSSWYTPPQNTGIRAFAGGSDGTTVTLSFIDTDGADACAWASTARDSSADQVTATVATCGFVWVKSSADPLSSAFTRTTKEGGTYLRMAENDPRTIYVTGGNWVREYGTKVWVSHDAGATWPLDLLLYNWDTDPYSPWPSDKLEWSAIGLDVGWDDNEYASFSVNARDSSQAGGTGYYFLHETTDGGATWKAPFTHYADTGPRAKGKRWSSTGLEVTSVLRLKFHPKNSQVGYASASDIAGLATEDGGQTWRISKAGSNTNYDYAFDPALPDTVFTATGDTHDFPVNVSKVLTGTGGVYRSDDRGRTWTSILPSTAGWARQWISIAYDPIHRQLYAGSEGGGLARATGPLFKDWAWVNGGLPAGGQIIPQIEIDPANGDAYCLLAGDEPAFSNRAATGIYYLPAGTTTWQLLRGIVNQPDGVPSEYLMWWSPTAFAIDFSRPARDTLWLVDSERQRAWLATGVWKSVDRGRTWNRSTQFTHPTSITIDSQDPNIVYASGQWIVDGSWGNGGPLYTTDGGVTWKRNEAIPFQGSLFGVAMDPNDEDSLFYLIFGGAMLHGPRPR
jgi:photosystem II stability/assembly factor-like uncharacterized protein